MADLPDVREGDVWKRGYRLVSRVGIPVEVDRG